jgi:hypothetical protein
LPAIGSIATANATSKDNMVRAMFIAAKCTAISYSDVEGSSDDFASNLAQSPLRHGHAPSIDGSWLVHGHQAALPNPTRDR